MRPAIELRSLQCVVTLAEELSFTRAAKKLYLAQPALSRHISSLEASLGVKLFERSTRQVNLTAAGMAFIAEARAALVHSQRAGLLARAVSRNEDSPIFIAYSPHYNFELLGAIMKRSRRYLGGNVIFTSSFTREQIQNVLDGTLDAGLCFFPVDDPELEAIPLFEEPVSVIVPAKHSLVLKRRIRISYRELQNESVVHFAPRIHPGFARELQQVWARFGYEPKATYDINTVAEAIALVAAGTGIAFFKSSLRNILPATVKMIDVCDQEKLMIKTGVIYRKDGHSHRTAKFLAVLAGLTHR